MKQQFPYLSIYTIQQSEFIHESKGQVRIQPLGLVFVHRTEGMGVFRDVIARIKDFMGGNVGSYNKRMKSINRMS